MFRVFSYNHHIYFPEKSESLHITNNYYSDLREEEDHISKVDIPSYIIKDNFLSLVLVYNPTFNGVIKELHPDFTPSINEGFNSKAELKFSGNGISITDNKHDHEQKSLECLASLFKIYLNDSLIEKPKFYFRINAKENDKGIFTIIDIGNLARGENILNVKRASFKKDSLSFVDNAFVPFWKE